MSKLPLDPYVLGALLGDGCFTGMARGNVQFANTDQEILNRVHTSLPTNHFLVHGGPNSSKSVYRIVSDTTGQRVRGVNKVLEALRMLGLEGCNAFTKFIPEPYMSATVKERIALLQGLCDTDGTVTNRKNDTGNAKYFTSSLQLAKDVFVLVTNLGGISAINSQVNNSGKLLYRVNVALPANMNPFYLSRKATIYRTQKRFL